MTSSGHGDSRVYNVREAAACTIGISLSRGRVVGVLIDLRGREVGDRSVDIKTTARSEVISTIVDIAAGLYESRGNREVLGVGVTLAGVVDLESETVVFAPDLSSHEDQWNNVELKNEVQELLQDRVCNPHLLVVVENDANALAMREYLLTGERYVVALLMSSSGGGIGVGAVVDGNVIYGKDYEAGEGGHIIVVPGGQPCRSGEHKGCLETVASASGILRRLSIRADSLESVDEGLIVLNDRIRQGITPAADAVSEAGESLGGFLATTMILDNPGLVAIYGHRTLVDKEQPSGARFTKGVTDGLKGGLSKGSVMHDRVRWQPLNKRTEAGAAAAAAMHSFLGRPDDWHPPVVRPASVGPLTA